MSKQYVEERDGGYYAAESRVSLDSIVHAYLRGESPEGITESFPAPSMEQIFGALAFYAGNRQDVDRYMNGAGWSSRPSGNSRGSSTLLSMQG